MSVSTTIHRATSMLMMTVELQLAVQPQSVSCTPCYSASIMHAARPTAWLWLEMRL